MSDSEFGFSVDGAVESVDHQLAIQQSASKILSEARQTMLQHQKLQSDLINLDRDFQKERRQRDLDLFRNGQSDLLNFLDQALVNPDLNPKDRSAIKLRRRVLTHLLENQERLISDFRFRLDSKKRRTATYEEIAPALLGPIKDQVRKIDSDDSFDIHNKAAVETFYGHILAAVSGSFELNYQLYHAKKDAIKERLSRSQYSPEQVFQSLGVLEPEFRLALMQREMSEAIKSALGQDSESIHLSALVVHYPSYRGNPDIKRDLETFAALEIEKTIWQKIICLFGLKNKNSFLADHQAEHPTSIDHQNLVELLIQIQKLALSEDQISSFIAGKLYQKTADILKIPGALLSTRRALEDLALITRELQTISK